MLYRFDDENKAIIIKKHDLPAPWINYLSNGRLNAFVSQAGGACTWLKNASIGRITRYRAYNLPIDSPGYYVYIKEKNGTVWSPTFRPVETELDDFSAIHKAGVTEFVAQKGSLEARLKLFMAPDYDTVIWDLTVFNNGKMEENLDIFAYVEFSQPNVGDEFACGYYWKHMQKTWFDKELDTLFYLFHKGPVDEKWNPLIYFTSDKKIEDFSGDRDAFMGYYRYEKNPIAIENGTCGNEEICSGEPCGALHIKMNIKPGDKDNAVFLLGTADNALAEFEKARGVVRDTVNHLKNKANVSAQFEKMEAFWKDYYSKFSCEIPDKVAQRQINIWGPLGAMNTGRFSRSVNTLAPGVRGQGVRDVTQDMLALTDREYDMAKRTFLFMLSLQFEAGNTVRASNIDGNSPHRPNMTSDNHLWIPFLAYFLLADNGDYSLLDEVVPYLADDALNKASDATVWEHLVNIINFTENHLGEHGLPLTLKGDWNDIIGKFSLKNKGESVFAAQQYVTALNYLIEIAKVIKAKELDWLMECKTRQTEAIMKHAWNGKWWYRCFDDDGNAIGDESNEYGRLWLNTQSWSVLSGVGALEQQKAGMDAVSKYLDTDFGLMILYPGFETWPKLSDPFSGYNPGNGENGAIFCHAHTWAVISEAILGNADRAWKYYNDLIPHNIIEKLGVDRYKAEPYAWGSNICGTNNPKYGWGNVTHISGAVPWMNVAATRYLLGVRPNLTGVVIDPCIPSCWEGFKVKKLYRGVMLNIEVINIAKATKGVKYIELNGQKLSDNFIEYEKIKNLVEVEIKVYM